MADITKYTLIMIYCHVLVAINQIVVAIPLLPQNELNNTKQFQEIEKILSDQISIDKLTTLDYYFFSYDVIDHKSLLIKFDITRTILFQQGQILYDAHLYVSKIPSVNYKINIEPFSGLFEKIIDGTITDHFTFCLVLLPNLNRTKFNITFNTNKTKSIYQEFLILSNKQQQQQQHIIHYCTQLGPNENRHPVKGGSKGDHVLLLLQLFLIVVILAILQVAHIIRDRTYKQRRDQHVDSIRHKLLSRKDHGSLSNEVLELLRLTSISEEESQEEQEETEQYDDSLTLSHRRLPSPSTTRKRSRSPSPSIRSANINNDTVDHILESEPWLQIPH